ncbi:LysM peptidoglycan-binding domain-containing protein [Kurthia gibsonii]|nr:LysM peptidoglycan-binding domain-containing protein [Kurthia gibsonii]
MQTIVLKKPLTKTSVRVYDGNKHSSKKLEGEIQMKWIKNNVMVICFSVVVLLFVGNVVRDTIAKTHVTEIRITEGDTLWSLAQKYSGDMKPQKWMNQVINENNLVDGQIMAGEKLTVPITNHELQQIELASDQ